MMKKINITIFFSLFWVSLFADNILVVGSNSSVAIEQTTIEIGIENDDPFVAFQVEIPLPDQLEYVIGSIAIALDRANGHEIATSIINGNTLLIFAWSSSNTSMNGNSGTVASFELIAGTVPGTYNLNPQNVIIGNASGQNILTGSQSGSVTIQCPDIHASASSLNFGEVIIGNNSSRSITIYNYGNLPLNISDITFDDPAFSVTGNTSFIVNAGNQQSVTIQFDA
ncbi:MAG: hypothetical protein EOM06_14530, partial [Sphingobacteriia bacterium]|nr:hypothetical protein [Sphingobacteriia bacterium]